MELEGGRAELGREKDMVLCKGPYSENVVAGGLDLDLAFWYFFTAVGFNTWGKKKKKKYVLILTKLLIFYRTSVSLARYRKSMSFPRANLLALC